MKKEQNSNYPGIARLDFIIKVEGAAKFKKRQLRSDKKGIKHKEEERNQDDEEEDEWEEEKEEDQEEHEEEEKEVIMRSEEERSKEEIEKKERTIEMVNCEFFCDDVHVLGGNFILERVEEEAKRTIMIKKKEDVADKKKTKIEIKGSYR